MRVSHSCIGILTVKGDHPYGKLQHLVLFSRLFMVFGSLVDKIGEQGNQTLVLPFC